MNVSLLLDRIAFHDTKKKIITLTSSKIRFKRSRNEFATLLMYVSFYERAPSRRQANERVNGLWLSNEGGH